ncbi:hypothetical protein C8J57DRAFT_1256115 [Mycena rebaudengoi]|nr:hypothetical protein C8J57DRAFT_1256115 [Mycena rebaudengoi]
MSEKGGKKRVEEMSHHWTGSERDAESPMLQTSFLRCGMLVEEKVRHRAQIMSEWRQWRRLHATFGGCGEYLMFNSGGGGGRRGRLTSGVWLGAEFEYAEDQEHLGNGQNGNRETGISGISGGIGGSITKCHSACDRHAIGVQYKHLSLGSITVVHWAQYCPLGRDWLDSLSTLRNFIVNYLDTRGDIRSSGGIRRHKAAEDGSPVRIPGSGRTESKGLSKDIAAHP